MNCIRPCVLITLTLLPIVYVIMQEMKEMEARLDGEFGKESDLDGMSVMVHSVILGCMGCPIDDSTDGNEANPDLFCVACNKLFRTPKT